MYPRGPIAKVRLSGRARKVTIHGDGGVPADLVSEVGADRQLRITK
jgi:hypothetical protein